MSKKMKHSSRRIGDFYSRQTRVYKAFGLWKLPSRYSKQARFAYNVHFWYMLIFWKMAFDASCFVQLVTNITSMNEIIKVFFIFATSLAVLGKYLSVKRKNQTYIELFELMHADEFLPTNAEEASIYERTVQLSRHVRDSYTTISLTALNAVLLTQFLLDRTQLPLSTYIPLNLEVNWRYCLVYLWQYLTVSVCCLMNIAFDSLSSSLFIYLSGQLDILAYRLEHLGASERDSQALINAQLKDCVRYYLRVLEMTRTVEYLLSLPMSLQILCSVLVLIANFYAMSLLSGPGEYANFVKVLIYQLCMLSQIFILCFYANDVSMKSTNLSQAIYRSNWVGWNKANRQLALLMMMLFDNPIRIKTINRCYSFNLASFTSIVNSSYSYFALLKKING